MKEKIKQSHVDRKAIVYVRQSSSFQVMNNLESRRLQYAMKTRVLELGWTKVDTIDQDLGKSAGGASDRPGFQKMVAEVCLGRVGAVAASELSRFSRNSRDWQQLLEVCRVVDTLLIDEEAIYDTTRSNDRLLLGLKGNLSEYELDLLRHRSQRARAEKAARAELGRNVPTGYINAGNGEILMTPDRRVQQAIATVFKKFLELGSARQVMMWFHDSDLTLPLFRWKRGGPQLSWAVPTYHSILRVLKNPTYAGAYSWGRTQTETIWHGGKTKRRTRTVPQNDWKVLERDHHEAYTSWETYERIQEMLRKNAQTCVSTEPGAAKRGPALLAGLIRCRRCGRKLTVRYTGGGPGNVLRYVCHNALHSNGLPRCIGFGGAAVDEGIRDEVLRVIRPAAIEAAASAHEQAFEQDRSILQALELELESRTYEVERAKRQFDAVEPENRLVAAQLERRWNIALERVQETQGRVEVEQDRRNQAKRAVPSLPEMIEAATNIERVWDDESADVRLKKRIVRTLINEVIADVDEEAAKIRIVIHWKGGVHTELEFQRRRAGQTSFQTPSDTVEAVRLLARICNDKAIAGWLTRSGLRTGKGNCWTRQRVTSLRKTNHIPVYSADRQEAEGWLNLTHAAEFLGIDRNSLRDRIVKGSVPAIRPLQNGPWLLNRRDLNKVKERVDPSGESSRVVNLELFDESSKGAL